MKLTSHKGFTLVELFVVITIIALLATIAFVALRDARLKAACSKGNQAACNLINNH